MRIVSWVFHPLLMATYLAVWLYFMLPTIFSPITPQFTPYFIGAIFITTAIIPAISVLFLKLSKRITSLELSNREERIYPFISIASFYGFSTYLFHAKLHVPWSVSALMLTSCLLIFILSIMSFKVKISIHAAATWGVAGLATAIAIRQMNSQVIYTLMPTYFMAGITSSSRLYLKSHTESEVWLGAVVGFVFCCLTYFILA